MTKFEQILRILNLIEQGERCRVADLAERLEVHPRTVYRYIASLKDAGFPIHYDETTESYVFSENYGLRRSLVSAEEHLALGLSKGLLGSALGDTFERTIEQVKDRCLRHNANLQARNRMESVFMMPGNVQEGRNLSIIMDLAHACTEHQRVLLTYRALYSNKTTQREVDPHYLFLTHDGFWNLRAHCRLRDAWRTFALDRVVECKLLEGEHFLPQMTIDEARNFQDDAFGAYMDEYPVEVTIRFSEDMKPYVMRKKWHSSQETRELPGGELEVKFFTRGVEGVRHWIFRWIPHVRGIEPRELCRRVMDDLEEQSKFLGVFWKSKNLRSLKRA